MEYLKTYEQASDFYHSKNIKYLILTKDEKYVVFNKVNALRNPLLYPIEDVDNNIEKYLLGAYPEKAI